MASSSSGRFGPHSHAGFLATNGFDSRAPPSTLAAQLVQDITVSTRPGTRPDEAGELKRLFGIIEKIKNEPEALRTNSQRVEHNHMLIYVYTRVVLEGLKWDNPFADLAHSRSEAAKAIDFLRVTIRETPSVLKYTPDEGATYLFRGHAPLWLWLLPRVLRMLGLSPCISLSPLIEDLCASLILATYHHGSLWDLQSAIMNYFKGNFTG